MIDQKIEKCTMCSSLCSVEVVREQTASTIYQEVKKFSSLMPRIRDSFKWMLADIQWRRNQQDNPGCYSTELKEAMEVFEILKRCECY